MHTEARFAALRISTTVAAVVVALMTCAAPAFGSSARAADSGDAHWLDRFTPPGTDGQVMALAVWRGQLYAGGEFLQAGACLARDVASWDGGRWSGIAPRPVYGRVLALAAYGGELIVGGEFREPNGSPAPPILRWNGSRWDSLGAALQGKIYALAVYRGELVAGGEFGFEADGAWRRDLARWNGSEWRSLGLGMNAAVRALLVQGDALIAGGDFTLAGSIPSQHVARWDGSSWTHLGLGLDGSVSALAEYGGELVAGGHGIAFSGPLPVTGVARWNGGAWTSLGALNAGVDALAAYGGDLYASGWIEGAGPAPVSLARWDGAAWSAVGSGTEGGVYAMRTFEGRLICGGTLIRAGALSVFNLAAWDGVAWASMGGEAGAPNGSVLAAAAYGGDLVVGGWFDRAGAVPAQHVARWDGSRWRGMGSGLEFVPLAFQELDGALFAAGEYSSSAPGGVARWDGAAWTNIATGFDGGRARALAVYQNALIVGGSYTSIDGTPTGAVARWNGASWSPVGEIDGDVEALAAYHGDLIACGRYLGVGALGEATVVRWDGARWSPLLAAPTGVDTTTVYEALAAVVFDDRLVVGGRALGGALRLLPSPMVWDGVRWETSGWSTPYSTTALAVYQGRLVAGWGDRWAGVWVPYDNPDGPTCASCFGGMGVWSGSGWDDLGSGIGGYVRSLAVDGPRLMVTGFFDRAGDKHSPHVALWDESPSGDRAPAALAAPSLAAPMPNPSTLESTIRYVLPQRSLVRLEIYDLQGRRVVTLARGVEDAGIHDVAWRGVDDRGRRVEPGLYLVRLRAADRVLSEKLVRLD